MKSVNCPKAGATVHLRVRRSELPSQLFLEAFKSNLDDYFYNFLIESINLQKMNI